MSKREPRTVSREQLSVIAWILGPLSAAQQALWEWNKREKRGESVGCILHEGHFIVGPWRTEQ